MSTLGLLQSAAAPACTFAPLAADDLNVLEAAMHAIAFILGEGMSTGADRRLRQLGTAAAYELVGSLKAKPGLRRYCDAPTPGCCASKPPRSRPRPVWTAIDDCAPLGRRSCGCGQVPGATVHPLCPPLPVGGDRDSTHLGVLAAQPYDRAADAEPRG